MYPKKDSGVTIRKMYLLVFSKDLFYYSSFVLQPSNYHYRSLSLSPLCALLPAKPTERPWRPVDVILPLLAEASWVLAPADPLPGVGDSPRGEPGLRGAFSGGGRAEGVGGDERKRAQDRGGKKPLHERGVLPAEGLSVTISPKSRCGPRLPFVPHAPVLWGTLGTAHVRAPGSPGRMWFLQPFQLHEYRGGFVFDCADRSNCEHIICASSALLGPQAWQSPFCPWQAFEGNQWWKRWANPSVIAGMVTWWAAFCECISAGGQRW